MDRCDNCDIDLVGGSVVTAEGKIFCCAGCADGGPCRCSYEGGNSRHPRNGHTDPIVSEMLFLDAEAIQAQPDSPTAN